MRFLIIFLSFIFLTSFNSFAQGGREVKGVVIDSTKQTLPGTSVKLVSGTDSAMTMVDINGKFAFPSVKGDKITITFSSIGYTSLKKHFTLDAANTPVDLGNIILDKESTRIGLVTINGVVPITLKEDTVQYSASAYKVRDNAPAEDLIKKLPGVDVDADGNVSTQGKQVTKIRINGKDFMGGDLQAATKSLPADIIENIQMIDDYGDQANLTGVKTGDPDKIMNITIRKDKNYGYNLQTQAGDGQDMLPSAPGVSNKNRYVGAVNLYTFKDDRQISVLGSINNTNVNTLFGGSGGSKDGITNAHSIGLNYRDQWGKTLSVYGSYSFLDNTTSSNRSTATQYFGTDVIPPSSRFDTSANVNERINHRFTWNMEWKPDTLNYLKISPSFSYSGTNSSSNGSGFALSGVDTTSKNTANSFGDSQAPNYGINVLYNHRFKNRSNISFYATYNSAPSWSFQNQDNVYTPPTQLKNVPEHDIVNIYSRTNRFSGNFSYLNPIGKRSYLEFSYNFSHSVTNNNRETDVLNPRDSASINGIMQPTYIYDPSLSRQYDFTFVTNRIGLNYRFVEAKYNYTFGITAIPSSLDGSSTQGTFTPRKTFNLAPTARFVYNFSRSQSFNAGYYGSSSAPSFNQLVPGIDPSNPNNQTQGNPDLKPSFNNNVFIRYNKFDFESGNSFFLNFRYSKIQDRVVNNTISDAKNNHLTQYLNANGYSNIEARVNFSKPWAERKYTLSLNGNIDYTNDVGYTAHINDIENTTQEEINSTTQKNIAKTISFTPQVRFRVDIDNVIDAQASTSYSIDKITNSAQDFNIGNLNNIRSWETTISGKNYFGDWTFSYDYTKTQNYGYNGIKVTNPNILNVYLERMFLKDKVGTIRLAAYDLFNQNAGYSVSQNSSQSSVSNVNRLSRYFLLTFTLRLKKFAGKAPSTEDPDMNGGGRGRGGRGGGGGRGNNFGGGGRF